MGPLVQRPVSDSSWCQMLQSVESARNPLADNCGEASHQGSFLLMEVNQWLVIALNWCIIFLTSFQSYLS